MNNELTREQLMAMEVSFDGSKTDEICHTTLECWAIWYQLSEEKKAPARLWFKKEFAKVIPQIQRAIAEDPENWPSRYHFGWGMGFRNALRGVDFGERYWPVHNLDCLYRQLIEDFVTS